MASLLGKADATLISAARSEAMANVPLDMSDVYEKREKNLKDFTTEVNKIWDKQFEEYKAFETRITDKSDVAITNALQGKTNDNMLFMVEGEVNRIKDKMKTFDKRDKGNIEWKKLEEELNKLVITTGANAEIFNGLNEAVTNGELQILGGDPKTLELYEKIVDDYNGNTSFAKGKYVDGDFVYTHPEDDSVTMTLAELKKKLQIKDPKPRADAQQVLNGVKKYAATSKNPLTERYTSDINNQLLKIMRTPNDVSNIMHERFEGLDFSFYDALAGKDPVLQGKIYDILDEMGGIDIDGVPGKENRETYASPENAYLLKQAIMKDKTIVADFLTENIVADNWKEGEKERADGTPKWQIPGTPEWERVRKANEESNLNQTKRLYKDIYYGAGENKVQGQILDNLYSMLDGGTLTINDIPYTRNPQTNAWRNGQDQSEMPGDDILKALQKQAGSYDLMLDPNFKQFSGATTSGAYTMPKQMEVVKNMLYLH